MTAEGVPLRTINSVEDEETFPEDEDPPPPPHRNGREGEESTEESSWELTSIDDVSP